MLAIELNKSTAIGRRIIINGIPREIRGVTTERGYIVVRVFLAGCREGQSFWLKPDQLIEMEG